MSRQVVGQAPRPASVGQVGNLRTDCQSVQPGKARPPQAKARATSGQVAMEFALLYGGVVLPMLFMVVFIARGLWVWHSVVDFTRYGARYAATHCWEPDGSASNVIGYMQANVPPMVDMNQFQNGQAILIVQYFSENSDGSTTLFDGSSCAGGICVPDTVSVSVTNYIFIGMSTYFSLPPVTIPDFTTSEPMESAGYQDASGVCVP